MYLWFNTTLLAGNVSSSYKFCIQSTRQGIDDAYHFFLEYNSIQNYLIYLLPNILSEAFYINARLERIKELELAGNYVELIYYYSLVIRRFFLFKIP